MGLKATLAENGMMQRKYLAIDYDLIIRNKSNCRCLLIALAFVFVFGLCWCSVRIDAGAEILRQERVERVGAIFRDPRSKSPISANSSGSDTALS